LGLIRLNKACTAPRPAPHTSQARSSRVVQGQRGGLHVLILHMSPKGSVGGGTRVLGVGSTAGS